MSASFLDKFKRPQFWESIEERFKDQPVEQPVADRASPWFADMDYIDETYPAETAFPEVPEDCTYFELRCSDTRVAECALDAISEISEADPGVQASKTGTYGVQADPTWTVLYGRLPKRIANAYILQRMMQSGRLCNSDWATLYTRDPENVVSMSKQGDEFEQARINNAYDLAPSKEEVQEFLESWRPP